MWALSVFIGGPLGVVDLSPYFDFQMIACHHYSSGTAVLQIGTALLYTRRLTVCDGGVYTCVATSANGDIITRNFTLQMGS